jgi:hypothetical protein
MITPAVTVSEQHRRGLQSREDRTSHNLARLGRTGFPARATIQLTRSKSLDPHLDRRFPLFQIEVPRRTLVPG